MEKNKKYFSIIGLISFAIVTISHIVFNVNNFHKESDSENEKFTMTFDFNDQNSDDSFQKKIVNGDYFVNFNQSVSTNTPDDCFRTFTKDSFIAVTDSAEQIENKGIKGLISLSITFSGGDTNLLNVSYGWENGTYYSTKGQLSNSNLIYDFDKYQPTYFKIENKNDYVINIKTLTITYSCHETTVPSQDGLIYTKLGSYGYSVKAANKDLTNVVIPMEHASEPVCEIEEKAFDGCKFLLSIEIGSNIQDIKSYAFRDCVSLSSIFIPKNVTSIGRGAFNNCSSITSISVDKENTTYDSRDNCNAIIKNATNTLVVGCKETIIRDSVEKIGNFAFYGCTNLTTIDIPYSVDEIGQSAFENCTSLSSVSLNNGLNEICGYAFLNCCALTSITFPTSLKSIGEHAFRECSALKSVTFIEDSDVTSIGASAFYGCVSLKSFIIPDLVTSISVALFGLCTSLESVLIPDGITIIDASAFISCTALTSINIPGSVTSIGTYCFSSCSKLKDIYFSGTSETWGNVSLGTDWHYNCPASVVHCSDGKEVPIDPISINSGIQL